MSWDMESERKKKNTPTLQGKHKRFLRGLGHHLEPVVYIGKEGFSDNLAQTAREVFKTRELVKVKLGKNCACTQDEAAAWLLECTGAVVVQDIGRTLLLYLPNTQMKPEQRITLPR
jgi:RNA-binding protein